VNKESDLLASSQIDFFPVVFCFHAEHVIKIYRPSCLPDSGHIKLDWIDKPRTEILRAPLGGVVAPADLISVTET